MDISSMISEPSKEHPQTCQAENAGELNKEQGQLKLAEETHGNNAELVVRPAMLSEILNSKKTDLFHSSEVKEFLMMQQTTLSSQPSHSGHDLNAKKESSDSDTSCDSHKTDFANKSSSKR